MRANRSPTRFSGQTKGRSVDLDFALKSAVMRMADGGFQYQHDAASDRVNVAVQIFENTRDGGTLFDLANFF